jgi:hypothetical protein
MPGFLGYTGRSGFISSNPQRVSLRRIHRFDPADTQFDDALVTSALIVFENAVPTADAVVEFTRDGTGAGGAGHGTGDRSGPVGADLPGTTVGLPSSSRTTEPVPRRPGRRVGRPARARGAS